MGLRLTTKVQVSGWRFLLRRLEHAIVRRDTRMFDDPLQFYSRSIALGIVVAVLILAGAALLAYFKPQGKLGGTSLFTDRATNQLYVLLSGQLHPVYNLTSARLVLGNPANPATVKSSELSKLPMGQTVGIPGAPYATPVSAGSTSIWTLCDTVARADSTSPVVQTAVIAMPLEIDASIDPLQSHEAVLVSYQGETWIVTTKGRHAIDLTDRALTSSMGIPVTARPTPISEGMFNALPDMGPWQLPPIPAAGAPNSLGLPDDLVIAELAECTTASQLTQYGIAPASARVYAEIVGNPTGWVEIVASQRHPGGTTTQTDAAAGVLDSKLGRLVSLPRRVGGDLYGSFLPGTQQNLERALDGLLELLPAGAWLDHTSDHAQASSRG